MNDDELLAALGAAVAEADDVDERRRRAARAAFTWRTVDAELAELLHDSALDAGAAVRSGGSDDEAEPRSLSFGSGGLALEVEYDGTDVVGQVVPPAEASLHLHQPDGGEVVVEVDAAGFFRVPDVATGPTRFVARFADRTLTSPWVNL